MNDFAMSDTSPQPYSTRAVFLEMKVCLLKDGHDHLKAFEDFLAFYDMTENEFDSMTSSEAIEAVPFVHDYLKPMGGRSYHSGQVAYQFMVKRPSKDLHPNLRVGELFGGVGVTYCDAAFRALVVIFELVGLRISQHPFVIE